MTETEKLIAMLRENMVRCEMCRGMGSSMTPAGRIISCSHCDAEGWTLRNAQDVKAQLEKAEEDFGVE